MYEIILNDTEKDILSYQLLKNLIINREPAYQIILNNCYEKMTELTKKMRFGLPSSIVEISIKKLIKNNDIVEEFFNVEKDFRFKKIGEMIEEFSDLQIIEENSVKDTFKVQKIFRSVEYREGKIYFQFDDTSLSLFSYLNSVYRDIRINKSLLNDSLYSFQLDRYIYEARSRGNTNLTAKITDLREMFNIYGESYKSFYDFKRFVLDRAFEYINSLSSLDYEAYYQRKKKGRIVDNIIINIEEKCMEKTERDIEEIITILGYESEQDFISFNKLEDIRLSPSEVKSLLISAEEGMKKYSFLEVNKESIGHLIKESRKFADSTKTKDTFIIHFTNIVKEDRANALNEKYAKALEN